MADLEVQVCGTKIGIRDGITFDKSPEQQRKALEEQIGFLADMISLLEFKNYILDFINRYQQPYQDKLIGITRARGRNPQEKYDNAEKKATPAQLSEADGHAADDVLKKMFPSKTIPEAIDEIFSKVRSLKQFAKSSWNGEAGTGRGVAHALARLLQIIPQKQQDFINKLDKQTVQLINTCDTNWGNNPMNLNVGKLKEVKAALEEILRLRLSCRNFELVRRAKEDIEQKNKEREGDGPSAQTSNWEDTYDKFLARNPWMPRPRLELGISDGNSFEMDTRGAGIIDGKGILGAGGKITLDWDRFKLGDYQLRVAPHYSFQHQAGLEPDNSASKHQAGIFISGQNPTPSYIPNFSFKYYYQNYQSDVPMFPNPNEESHNLKVQADELLYAGRKAALSLEVGDQFSKGTLNGLGYIRNAVSVGPKLTFNTPYPMAFSVGYRYVGFQEDMRLGSYDPASSKYYNSGHGVYGAFQLDASRKGAGIFSLGGSYDVMEKQHNEARAFLDHRIPIKFGGYPATLVSGFDYRAENLNNGLYHRAAARVGLEDMPITRSGFATWGAHLSAGYQALKYDANSGIGSQRGGVIGIGLTLGIGGHKDYGNYRRALATVAPAAAGLTAERVQSELLGDKDGVYSDPTVRAILGRSSERLDAYYAAAYLVQLKAGKINRDYTLAAVPGNLEEAARAVDGNESGRDPDPSREVVVGDVAPLNFYVGGKNSTALTRQQMDDDYLPHIYRLTPDKIDVLKAAAIRHQMIKKGLKVKASHEATRIAYDLLNSLGLIRKGNLSIQMGVPAVDEEIAAGVVGPASIEYVREVLRIILHEDKSVVVGSANEKEIEGLIKKTQKLNRELVDAVMAYVYIKILGKKGMVSKFDLRDLGDKRDVVWQALKDEGYIGEDGELMPKFDEKKMDKFGLLDPLILDEKEIDDIFEIFKTSKTANVKVDKDTVPAGKRDKIWQILIKAGYIENDGTIKAAFDEKKKAEFKQEISKHSISSDDKRRIFEVLSGAVQKLPSAEGIAMLLRKAELKSGGAAQPAAAAADCVPTQD